MQDLDAAAAVGMGVGKERPPDPARGATCQKPGRAVLTAGPDPGRHADAATTRRHSRRQRRLERRKISRDILTVTVEHANQMAARRKKRRAYGRALAGPRLVAQHPKLRDRGGAVGKLGRACIGAGVVDIDDFETAPLQGFTDLVDQRTDIAGLVHHRNEHRDLNLRLL